MKIISTEVWDDSFFNQFSEFKNQLFINDSNIFNESVEDFKAYFSSESPITKEYIWKAYLVIKEDKILARGVFSSKMKSAIGQVGFLEFARDPEASRFLFNQIESDAKIKNIKELRGPANINFFISYRWKSPQGGEPFYSEPVVPDYYHQYIKESGYSVSETWDTFKIDFKKSMTRWQDKQGKIKKKSDSQFQKIEIKFLFPWNFDKNLKIIHKLFVESYKQMGEYEEIDFESFKLLYKDFKYIVNPLFSYIAYYKDEPIGFVLNIFDSLHILKKFSKRKPTFFERLITLIKLQFNFKRLLIMYSGRVPTSQGEEVKGLQIKVSKTLGAMIILFRVKELYVCFQSSNSPSKRSFDEDTQSPYSQYVMYRKVL